MIWRELIGISMFGLCALVPFWSGTSFFYIAVVDCGFPRCSVDCGFDWTRYDVCRLLGTEGMALSVYGMNKLTEVWPPLLIIFS